MMNYKHWHMLIVEDEVDSMELIRDWLSYQDIDSTGASNAEDALDILHNLIPTVIVIDLELPGMDGWSLLRLIRQNRQLAGVPCVAITAYHSNELAKQAVRAGFDAYFPKPLDAGTFVNKLVEIVEH